MVLGELTGEVGLVGREGTLKLVSTVGGRGFLNSSLGIINFNNKIRHFCNIDDEFFGGH